MVPEVLRGKFRQVIHIEVGRVPLEHGHVGVRLRLDTCAVSLNLLG